MRDPVTGYYATAHRYPPSVEYREGYMDLCEWLQKPGWYLLRADGSECGPWIHRDDAVRALYEDSGCGCWK